MKNNNKTFPLSVLFAAIAAASSHTSLQAQTKPIASLEEIIVSAQRRDEMLQDVPVSITAYGSMQLGQAGTSTIDELQKSAPSVTLEASRGTNSTLTAFIRGIGQQDPLWGFEPGVGLYLDDVYLARPQGAVLDVYDIERIEILRGPQGTLYGKNTIGGAVKYVSKHLSGETEGSVKVAVGSYNQLDGTVSGQTAITDNFYIGASVASLTRDGYGELITHDDENYNKDVLTGRLSAEWHASDNLVVRVNYDQTKDTSNAKGGHRLTVGAVGGEPVLDDVFDSRAGTDPTSEVKTKGGAVRVEYLINDDLEFKSITAYREGDSTGPIDFDNLPENYFDVPGFYDDHQFSQEFQLAYSGEKISAIAGLYYFDGSSAGRFDAILGRTLALPLIQTTFGEVETESSSIFADMTYDISDDWSVTVGGRYTNDKKDVVQFSQQYFSLTATPDDIFVFPGVSPNLLSDYSNDRTDSEFSPRIATAYHTSEEVMVYASYSEGFKSGGYDMRGNQFAVPDTVNGFDPETVDAFEVGIKGEYFDRRLRVNLSAFYSEYNDMQVVTLASSALSVIPVQNVENVGQATIQGVELESMAQFSENWSMVLTAGYIDTNIDEWLSADPANPGSEIDIADQRDIQNTPQWTGHAGLSFDKSYETIGDIHAGVSISYRGAVQMFETPTDIDFGGYSVWDANIVWYSPDQHWTVGLHGKNLGDKEYRTTGYNFPNNVESSIIGYYGAPRTVALQAEYAF